MAVDIESDNYSQIREGVAVSFGFIAVFMLVCMLSYSLPLLSSDPALQAAGDNLCGSVGFYIAHYMFSFLGVAAFIPPLFLLYFSVVLFKSFSLIDRLPSLMVGITLLLISLSGLLSGFNNLFFPSELVAPGGQLGLLVSGLLAPVFGKVGGFLLFFLLLIISCMIVLQISLVQASTVLSALGFWLGRKTKKGAALARDKACEQLARIEKKKEMSSFSEPDDSPAIMVNSQVSQEEDGYIPFSFNDSVQAAEADKSVTVIGHEKDDYIPLNINESPDEPEAIITPDSSIKDGDYIPLNVKADEVNLDNGDSSLAYRGKAKVDIPIRPLSEDGYKAGSIYEKEENSPHQPPLDVEQEELPLEQVVKKEYVLPPLSLLDENDNSEVAALDREHYIETSKILLAKLADFKVKGTIEGVSPGPVVTTYEFAPAPGVKINKIVGLSDDLAMAIKVDRIRVGGSVPGKAALAIEIPNPIRKTVYLRDILVDEKFNDSDEKLLIGLGFDVVGHPVVANLAKMPHLLIAGATGAGKSVAINAFISSILFKATPDEVRFLMIDPKRIELSVYEGIPHLLHPVVVEPQMASRALLWAVREMERRYKLLEANRVKSFLTYNQIAEEPLPYIVIVVDELADLMMVASKDVEHSIARLAQMARAAGMHIVLATQRPSVDVLTGLIKANFPTRISFKVSSKVDSRTILDTSGAEHLLGMGDMLFLPPGAAKLQRIHGAYISEEETERLIEFLKEQGEAEYDPEVMEVVEKGEETGDAEEVEYDARYDEAVAIVTEAGQASISMVQRRLRIGYNRAARIIEVMEKDGLVGPADGAKPREVLARRDYSADI